MVPKPMKAFTIFRLLCAKYMIVKSSRKVLVLVVLDDAWCIVPRVSNGRPETSHSSFPPGVVAFECDHGYEFKGKVLEALCENGVWKVLPECTRKCPLVANVSGDGSS